MTLPRGAAAPPTRSFSPSGLERSTAPQRGRDQLRALGVVLALAFAVLMTSACASFTEPMGVRDPFAINQPFQGVARNDRMLSIVTQAPAIVVRPIYGLGAEKAELLRARVMTILRTHDVPALAESAASIAWVLQGQAAFIQLDSSNAAGEISGTIAWALTDAHGDVRAKFTTPLNGNEDTIADTLFGPMADQIAAQVDLALTGPTTEAPPPVAVAEVPRASVAEVAGAPGDGNSALTKALVALLPFKGIKIAEAKDAAWRVEGKVKVSEKSPTEDLVTLDWHVLDAQGKELGSIKQQNAVPHKRLDGPWKEIAAFAAEAAAEGISQLIHTYTAKGQAAPAAAIVPPPASAPPAATASPPPAKAAVAPAPRPKPKSSPDLRLRPSRN